MDKEAPSMIDFGQMSLPPILMHLEEDGTTYQKSAHALDVTKGCQEYVFSLVICVDVF